MSPIKVTYWPFAHGRALTLNLMCEYAEADYEFVDFNPQSKVTTANNFAVPAVQFDDDGEWYSQLMVAITALGKKLNLSVKDENELKGQNTLTNIYDIACEAFSKRTGFKTVEEANGFLQTRFSAWCETIESNYKWASKNGDGPYWEGDNVSYVDFIMIHLIEQVAFMYGKDRTMAVAESKMPNAFNAYKMLRKSTKVEAFMGTKPIFPDYLSVNAELLEA